jgi:hypothetical protein
MALAFIDEKLRPTLRVCWKCKNLWYCPHCKKFECVVGRSVGKDVCAFRESI